MLSWGIGTTDPPGVPVATEAEGGRKPLALGGFSVSSGAGVGLATFVPLGIKLGLGGALSFGLGWIDIPGDAIGLGGDDGTFAPDDVTGGSLVTGTGISVGFDGSLPVEIGFPGVKIFDGPNMMEEGGDPPRSDVAAGGALEDDLSGTGGVGKAEPERGGIITEGTPPAEAVSCGTFCEREGACTESDDIIGTAVFSLGEAFPVSFPGTATVLDAMGSGSLG